MTRKPSTMSVLAWIFFIGFYFMVAPHPVVAEEKPSAPDSKVICTEFLKAFEKMKKVEAVCKGEYPNLKDVRAHCIELKTGKELWDPPKGSCCHCKTMDLEGNPSTYDRDCKENGGRCFDMPQ